MFFVNGYGVVKITILSLNISDDERVLHFSKSKRGTFLFLGRNILIQPWLLSLLRNIFKKKKKITIAYTNNTKKEKKK